ncbi:hypothetical protein BD324DRAFT_613219 [Kockovaella imperatae]|uniref:Uncharacterized protein n=1 Tax=Kockovaella imperatae TaxID=4999 RepID=A0A1Y1USX1_9TREE|nr:hypothetical protein BD324DRAFT_613219 [Kockovaella imperatae]ORX41108.1 hypothetical protein BD324DRAFT_613219 [Kockovaella imperatae]
MTEYSCPRTHSLSGPTSDSPTVQTRTDVNLDSHVRKLVQAILTTPEFQSRFCPGTASDAFRRETTDSTVRNVSGLAGNSRFHFEDYLPDSAFEGSQEAQTLAVISALSPANGSVRRMARRWSMAGTHDSQSRSRATVSYALDSTPQRKTVRFSDSWVRRTDR